MSVLAKIIMYFSKNNSTEEIRIRVWKRLGNDIDNDAEEALHAIWKSQAGNKMSRHALDDAYHIVAKKAELNTLDNNEFLWGRFLLRVAVWMIPIFMLAGSYFFYQKGLTQRKILAETHFIQEFSRRGEIKKVILPDSSEVWLNSGSVLVYPSRFSNNERNIVLIGEAYFKVRHIDSSPFQVSVNRLNVKDIGTSFDIQSYPTLDDMRVTLNEGLVSVSDGRTDYRLKPNQQLIYSNFTGKVSIEDVDAKGYAEWRNGGLQFDGEPLTKVLKMLEYRYDVHFQIVTNRYDRQYVRLRFNPQENIEDILSVISLVVPDFKWKMVGKKIVVQ